MSELVHVVMTVPVAEQKAANEELAKIFGQECVDTFTVPLYDADGKEITHYCCGWWLTQEQIEKIAGTVPKFLEKPFEGSKPGPIESSTGAKELSSVTLYPSDFNKIRSEKGYTTPAPDVFAGQAKEPEKVEP